MQILLHNYIDLKNEKKTLKIILIQILKLFVFP